MSGSLAAHQTYSSNVRGSKQEVVIIPSQSQAAFGGTFTLDIKEKSCIINNLVIVFNVSAISGLTGSVAGFPNFSPTHFWAQRVDIVMNNQIIHTVYDLQNFIDKQLWVFDEDRISRNLSGGLYNSSTHRNSLAIVNGQNYYLHIPSFLRQAQLALLPGQTCGDLQLRFQMAPLANIVNQSTLTGTPVATINSVQAHVGLTRLSAGQSQAMVAQLVKQPKTYLFSYPRIQTTQIPAGVTQFSFPLSSITGAISHFFFVVRPSNALNGSNAYNFTQLASWLLQDPGGSPVTTSGNIPDRASRLVWGDLITRSTFLCDPENGINNSYVYVWQFCPSAVETFTTGSNNGGRLFNGSEQLQVTFPSATATAMQLDSFFFQNYSVTMGMSSLTTAPVNDV